MTSFRTTFLATTAIAALALGAGCSSESSSDSPDSASESSGSPGSTGASEAGASETVPDRFWSATPLAGALNVKDVRDAANPPSQVVVRGTLQDFGELATFRLVEDSLVDCSEMAEPDHCATPWDYCCADPAAVQRYTINVELLGEDEFPGSWKLAGFHGLDRLSEVVVQGKLITDEAGNMRIAAEKIAMQ